MFIVTMYSGKAIRRNPETGLFQPLLKILLFRKEEGG